MTLRQRLFHGVAWSAVSTWIRNSISLITFLFLAQSLGPEILGLGAMVWSVISFCQAFTSVSILESLVQRERLEAGHLDTMFWAMQAIGLALLLLGIVGAPWLAAFFNQPIISELTPWAMLAVYFWATTTVPHSLLRRNLRFERLATAAVLGELAGSLIGLAMAFSGFGVWSLIALYVVNAFVCLVATWVGAGWRPKPKVSRQHFNDLFHFNVGMLTINFFQSIEDALPPFIIGPILGPAALGIYSLGRRFILSLSEIVLTPLRSVALPGFAHVQAQEDNLKQLFLTTMRFSIALSIPVFIGVMVTASEFVPLALGPQWIESIVIIQILALLGIRKSVYGLNTALIRALGHPEWQSFMALLRMLATAALLLLLIQFGVVGAALAVVGASFLIWPISTFFVKRLTHLSHFRQLEPFIAPVLAASIMAVSVIAWKYITPLREFPYLDIASMVFLGAVTYGAALMLFEPKTVKQAVALVATMGRTDQPKV